MRITFAAGAALLPSCARAFAPSSTRAPPLPSLAAADRTVAPSSSTAPSSDVPDLDMDEFALLRDEIEALKDQARVRAGEVSVRMAEIASVRAERREEEAKVRAEDDVPAKASPVAARASPVATRFEAVPTSAKERVMGGRNSVGRKGEAEAGAPLIGSHWKIQMNVGREKGTWMPNTWGASGDRLLLNLELRLDSDPMPTRDALYGDAQKFSTAAIVNGDVTLGPSRGEGSRLISVRPRGGWRVARGEGPGGSDVLRLYLDVDEDVRHRGGDVYVPRGRVYLTCGFHELRHRGKEKVSLMEQAEALEDRYNRAVAKSHREGLFSLDKIKYEREKWLCVEEQTQVRRKYSLMKTVEPNLSDLRPMRSNPDIALTKEGSICIGVKKTLGHEYHILGRFALASTMPHENTE